MSRPSAQKRPKIRDLLSLYYPVHYQVGIDLETRMGQGRISRKQTAVLWMIHSDPEGREWMRRKLIEDRLSSWFEISNSSVSNLLRSLSKPPLGLIEQKENPESGRENLVRLTQDGHRFVEGMVDAATDYLLSRLDHVPASEMDVGIGFLKLAFQPLVTPVASPADAPAELAAPAASDAPEGRAARAATAGRRRGPR